MPTRYTLPQYPLEANVWFAQGVFPPVGPPDAELQISLSPLDMVNLGRANDFSGPFLPTHIIRTATNLRIQDGFAIVGHTNIAQGSVWECPPGSGHFWITCWAQIVGAGFPNEHHRVYVQREGNEGTPPPPPYAGYI